MKNQILRITLLVTSTVFVSCNNSSKRENVATDVKRKFKIETTVEIENWKKELVDTKQLGTPCDFEPINDQKIKEWTTRNENQLDGLPKNNADIRTVVSDFDGDAENDLLMYFISENCTGHNGDSPSFAKVVYANGTTEKQLMNNIKQSIIKSYKDKMKTDNTLKEITDDYLDEQLTISYKDGLTGKFSLYTNEDAYYSPTYTGTYRYDMKNKKSEIVIKVLKK